jgi:hypothetical protein
MFARLFAFDGISDHHVEKVYQLDAAEAVRRQNSRRPTCVLNKLGQCQGLHTSPPGWIAVSNLHVVKHCVRVPRKLPFLSLNRRMSSPCLQTIEY